MNKNLPTYQIVIDPLDATTGLGGISLVKYPAVKVDFLRFNEENPVELHFNEEQHIITGIALIPNTPIYRRSEAYGEHNIVFSEETIKQIAEKASMMGVNQYINIEHDPSKTVGGIVLLESYFIDHSRGVVPSEFSDLPDGSWVVSYKVNNLELWDLIKSGEVKGFSIEGLFAYDQAPVEEPEVDWVEEEYLDFYK